MRHQGGEKERIAANAADRELIERVGLRRDRCRAIARVGDELGHQRIIIDRDFGALADARIEARRNGAATYFRWRAPDGEPSGRGQEIALRILGADAGLDGPAVETNVLLPDREMFAGGDADHLFDEIDAGHAFRHRMLDLEARIHFEEANCAPG